MSDLDKIKYKWINPPWIKKIFIETGESDEFNSETRRGLKEELEEWLKIDGNEIEPQITDAEQEVIDAENAQKALDNQEKELLRLIKKNEYHLINPKYSDDLEDWSKLIATWHSQRETVKSGILVEIAAELKFS